MSCIRWMRFPLPISSVAQAADCGYHHFVERTCYKCLVTKPLATGFHRNPHEKTGYKFECKGCCSLAARRWQMANREKLLLIRKRYKQGQKWKAARQRYILRKRFHRLIMSALICEPMVISSAKERRVSESWIRTRFIVLTRDAFTCLYCGRKPPEVKLEVDHVIPRSKGGSNKYENLKTACWECNRGKSDLLIP